VPLSRKRSAADRREAAAPRPVPRARPSPRRWRARGGSCRVGGEAVVGDTRRRGWARVNNDRRTPIQRPQRVDIYRPVDGTSFATHPDRGVPQARHRIAAAARRRSFPYCGYLLASRRPDGPSSLDDFICLAGAPLCSGGRGHLPCSCRDRGGGQQRRLQSKGGWQGRPVR
jgi:hypothetical protein